MRVEPLMIESKQQVRELGLTAPSINKVLTTLSAIFMKAIKTTPRLPQTPFNSLIVWRAR